MKTYTQPIMKFYLIHLLHDKEIINGDDLYQRHFKQ